MFRPFPLTAALTLAVVPFLSGQSREVGQVVGRVKLTPRVPGAALASTAYPRRTIGQHEQSAIPEIRNVVVYLKDVAVRGRVPTRVIEMRQEHESFVPHVVAITTQSSVAFPNADPFFHNVFSLSGAASFDLGRFPKGQTRTREFDKAGIVKVYCHIHSHMSATILVLDHPHFAVPNLDGTFELPDVPVGEYTIVGWHERVGERTAKIRVESGRPVSIDLSLPVEDAR